jgi:hypothetical protein
MRHDQIVKTLILCIEGRVGRVLLLYGIQAAQSWCIVRRRGVGR